MSTGVVKFYDRRKAFGFITRDDDQKDFFVHISQVQGGDRTERELYKGDRVEFEPTATEKGLMAKSIKVLSRA